MTTVHIIILLLTGSGAGFAAGLLGIGGGFIMVPVQYLVFLNTGISADMAMKMAIGTNLLVILPIAVSGAWRHHRERLVFWRAAIIMGSGSLVGAIGGSTIATHLPGAALKMAFGVIILLSCILMLSASPAQSEEEPKNNPWLWVACALLIGIVSGSLGVGGGILVIPVMTLVLKFQMHRAVATSLAMMIFTAAGGVIGYIINGIGVANLPAYSMGYINLPSWFFLAVTSVGMTQVGAITARHLPARQLKYIFVILMFYIGLKMLGVFDWLGWPI